MRGSTAMIPNRQYNSSFASKGALLSDVKTVLSEIDMGQSPDQMRRAVIKDDLLDRGTLQNRQTVWREIARRYISGRDPEHVETLARMAARCPNPAAADLVLFYEYCHVDTLLYDLTAWCTYDLYHSARTAIDRVDINEWLSQQEAAHPEIATWSPATRNRLVSSYLATIRDFGLVTGARQKEFHKVYVPRQAFVYALYHQKERGMEGKALIGSTDWRLFLLSEREVVFLLEDAALGGFIHFRRAGDIYDLRFTYDTLNEAVHAITG
ncbi:MAG: DUF1819 family protein [Anaerolineae bacterium]